MSDSADKRSVHTDALATLGTIIDETQKRDAIHLAVEPVIAGQRLDPGDHVKVSNGVATMAPVGEGLGIVDPFLVEPVRAGQRFWFVMYPRKITSLRHVWAHPAFPDEPGTPAPATAIAMSRDSLARAKQRIHDIVDQLGDGLTYDKIMQAAEDWLEQEDYLVQNGRESWQYDFPAFATDFWCAYAVITGKNVPEDKRQSFFSCSC